MSLTEDLNEEVKKIFRTVWETRNGKIVPTPEDLKLGNDAIKFEKATVLYADLSGSTNMVDKKTWSFSAEIYKSFLFCAAKIIRDNGGVITSYDGDRVMGMFIGESQSSSAAKCGLKINYAVDKIINPALVKQYPNSDFKVKQVVGIDTSEIYAARTGVRGGNDIVWVGRSANYAAKLTELNLTERTWITDTVFERLSDDAKYGGKEKTIMWKKYNWTQKDDITIYGSAWTWTI